jgi:hypothetical protein
MEGSMLAKAVSVIVAGVLTVIAVRRTLSMLKTMQHAKVRSQAPRGLEPTRLRQDPKTGVYYPDHS